MSGNAYPVIAPSAPRSISKSTKTPPLPVRMEIGRIRPSCVKRRTALIFSRLGHSSAFSMTQEGCASTMQRITEGDIITPLACG